MARITIRHLDDALLARLRERAAAAGRSMEQEVREILTAACADQSLVVARLRPRHAAFRGRTFSDSAELVRDERDRRSG
jgi:plasmid stability protein